MAGALAFAQQIRAEVESVIGNHYVGSGIPAQYLILHH